MGRRTDMVRQVPTGGDPARRPVRIRDRTWRLFLRSRCDAAEWRNGTV